ncbi:MAG: hypothetical protein HC880_16985, partial [Bacteroidia bacterium]|nr:hypothetical protein [Bacteroidia bacterium]
ARHQNEDYISPSFTYTPEALDKMLNYLTDRGTKSVEAFQLQILCQHAERIILEKNQTPSPV